MLTLAGCSATQAFFIREDGSGRADIEITVDPVLSAYVRDLGEGMGMGEAPLFDPAAIDATFSLYPELTLIAAQTRGKRTLLLTIEFASIDALFRDSDEILDRIVRFEARGDERFVAAEVDRRGVERALRYARFDPQVTEILLPPAGEMSAGEYREYLAWAMEEYEGGTPLADVFAASRVSTTVTVDGAIVDVVGGETSGSGSVARFTTPLLEILTTAEPERYGVRFRRN